MLYIHIFMNKKIVVLVSLIVAISMVGSFGIVTSEEQPMSEETIQGEIEWNGFQYDENGVEDVHIQLIPEDPDMDKTILHTTPIENSDGNGEWEKEVPEGNYTIFAFYWGEKDIDWSTDDWEDYDYEHASTIYPETVEVTEGTNNAGSVELKNVKILEDNIDVVDGSGDESEDYGVDIDNIQLESYLNSGMLSVQLYDQEKLNNNWRIWTSQDVDVANLSDTGVDEETEFEISFKLLNYDPDIMTGLSTNANWEVNEDVGVEDIDEELDDDVEDNDITEITIESGTVNYQSIFSYTDDSGTSNQLPIGPMFGEDIDIDELNNIDWPEDSDDQSDYSNENIVSFQMLESDKAYGYGEEFENISVVTNAQAYSIPTVDENGSLNMWVGAPSLTEDGEEHEGFYSAQIPDEKLEDWDIDPDNADEELNVTFDNEHKEFTVEDTDDGILIDVVNMSYSSGEMSIEPSDKDTDEETPAGKSESSNIGIYVFGVGLVSILLGGFVLSRDSTERWV